MLTRKDKEREVIRLYNEGKNIREIAKAVRMSFSNIGAIIREYTGEDKVKEEKSLTKKTQALKMFYEGKNCLQVVIVLDMSPLDIKEIYEEFLELKNLSILTVIYENLRNEFPLFIKFYNTVKKKGISETEILNLIEVANHAKDLNNYYINAVQEVTNLLIKKDSINREIQNSYKELEEVKDVLDYLKLEIRWIEFNNNPDNQKRFKLIDSE